MPTKTEAVEVFRQFAWSLAGKLAAPDPAARREGRRRAKPSTRPAKGQR